MGEYCKQHKVVVSRGTCIFMYAAKCVCDRVERERERERERKREREGERKRDRDGGRGRDSTLSSIKSYK